LLVISTKTNQLFLAGVNNKKKLKLTVLLLPEAKGSKHTLWPTVEVAQSICDVTHFQKKKEREKKLTKKGEGEKERRN